MSLQSPIEIFKNHKLEATFIFIVLSAVIVLITQTLLYGNDDLGNLSEIFASMFEKHWYIGLFGIIGIPLFRGYMYPGEEVTLMYVTLPWIATCGGLVSLCAGFIPKVVEHLFHAGILAFFFAFAIVCLLIVILITAYISEILGRILSYLIPFEYI